MPSSLAKEIDHVDTHYAALVAASPFCAIASAGPGGLDVSPRGDGPGSVAVADSKTLLLPDRRGNNRADTLKNIVADPRVALLFLIPGVGEALRVNGTARISIDPDLCRRFAMDGKHARSCAPICGTRPNMSRAPPCPAPARFWKRSRAAPSTPKPTMPSCPSACRASFTEGPRAQRCAAHGPGLRMRQATAPRRPPARPTDRHVRARLQARREPSRTQG